MGASSRTITFGFLLAIALLLPASAWAQDFRAGIRVVGTVPVHAVETQAAPVAGARSSGVAGPNSFLSQPTISEIAAQADSIVPSRHWPFVRSEPQRVAPFPIVLNHVVQRYVDEMLAHPGDLTLSFERSRPYLSEMTRVLEEQGVPRDLVYLAFAESCFTKRGAGPWQLSKATARRFGLMIDSFVDERRDPIKSTRAAAEYLATLHDETDDWHVALVGWNRGEGWLDRFLPLRGIGYTGLLKHLPANTRGLLNRFMAVAVIAHHPREYGLQAITFTVPPSYHVVKVKGGTLLSKIAAQYDTTVAGLHRLNSALLRDRVPPHVASFEVRIPDREDALLIDPRRS